jgi:serine phosphatase RsbU (regulator of sigma subunit)
VSPPRPSTDTTAAGSPRPTPSVIEREFVALIEIGRTMVSHFDYEHALAAVIERTARILDSTTGAFMLYDEATGLLTLQQPAFGMSDDELARAYRVRLTDTESNAVKVFTSGRAYMTNEFRSDPRMSQRFVRMSVAQRLMTVPLQVQGRSIGVFHVQDKRSGDYTPEDLHLLELLAPTLAVLITSARMMRELRDHKQRAETALAERQAQVQEAARIQRELLPRTTPNIDGYRLAAGCLPAQDVAGDFYDWVTFDGTLVVTLADVMGKGVGASLVSATLRAALRAAPHKLSPTDRVRRAEESIALSIVDAGLFVTLFHGQLDLASGLLRYVDAGHGHCAVMHADGRLTPLDVRSLPVGVQPGEPYLEGRLRLEPGDTLIVYSDGLVEHGSTTGDLSDFRRELTEAADPEDLVGRLLGRMPASLADDVTVLILHRLGTDETGGRRHSGPPPVRRSPTT